MTRLTSAGYAVVRVNCRGSTGYRRTWRDALVARLGAIEMEELGAVRTSLEADRAIDPAKVAMVGRSWGGYMTLFALGVEPDRWSAGVAFVPLANFAMSQADEPAFMTAGPEVTAAVDALTASTSADPFQSANGSPFFEWMPSTRLDGPHSTTPWLQEHACTPSVSRPYSTGRRSRRCATPAGPGPRVVIVEQSRAPVPGSDLATFTDVVMAALTGGGKERTIDELDQMGRRAGLALEQTLPPSVVRRDRGSDVVQFLEPPSCRGGWFDSLDEWVVFPGKS